MLKHISVFLLLSLVAEAQQFPKGIKYLGGPGFADVEQVRESWDNSLNLTDREVTFAFVKNVLPVEIVSTSSITSITYGQATTRRVGKWVAAGIILAPVALVGIFHKSRQHRVLVEWVDDQKRERGLLMQAHKDQFVGILNGLTFRTGKPIYAEKEDREWLFTVGVKAQIDPGVRDAVDRNSSLKPEGAAVDTEAETVPTITREPVRAEVVARPSDGKKSYIDCGSEKSRGTVPFSSHRYARQTLNCSEEVMVLGSSGAFTRVRTQDNLEGNVATRFVKTAP